MYISLVGDIQMGAMEGYTCRPMVKVYLPYALTKEVQRRENMEEVSKVREIMMSRVDVDMCNVRLSHKTNISGSLR